MTTTDAFSLELSGPLDGPVPMSIGDIDLGAIGYVEEEFVCAGVATAYDGEPTEDGRWTATPSGTAEFTTRFVVKRPVSPAACNGTVLVEWLNVSGGGDGAPDWMYFHREITRAGMVHVGVSAQKVGIDGGASLGAGASHLKATAPERYGDLVHPGDAYSYDMYTQVARVVRGDLGRSVLGDLVAERILAIGESQSAAFLVTYVNGIDPLAQVFDGFLIHGRGGSGADLTNAGFFGDGSTSVEEHREQRRQSAGQRIRDDVRVPVLTLQSETDVVTMAGSKARQDDGARTRLWEVAGAAHADVYLMTCRSDDGTLSGEEMAGLFAPATELLGMTVETPPNTGAQQHYVGQAAVAALDAWVRDGTAPASAPVIELTPGSDGIVLDDDGLARGGIRTPWVDAPLHGLTGLASPGGPVLMMLFGGTEIWDAARLAQRYPGGRDEYLTAMRASLQAAVDAGFLLAADQAEIDALLAASYDRSAGGAG